MANNFDPSKINEGTKELLKSKGINPDIFQSKGAAGLLSSLSKAETDKINSILNDRKALEQVLSSDRAKAVINQLFGNNK